MRPRFSSVLLMLSTAAPAFAAPRSIFDDDDPTPIVRPAAPAPADPAAPRVVAPKPAPPAVAVAPPLIPAPAARVAVPDKAALSASRKLFREMFAADLNDKSATARRALAMKLVDGAARCGDKPADQFVLLAGARQAAVEAHDIALTFRTADALSSAFEIDSLAIKADSVTAAGVQGGTPAQTAVNVQNALDALGELFDAEDYAAAAKVGQAVLRTGGEDPLVRRLIPRRIKEAEALRVAYAVVARDRAKLKAAPEDPAANQAVGAYLCFARDDWAAGLPMLARGANPDLKRAAAADLSSPADSDALRKLGDQWAAVAARQIEVYRTGGYERALAHYRKAAFGAAGMQKLAVEQSVQKVSRLIAPRRLDLLALFDPAADPVTGKWNRNDAGELVSPGEPSRLEAPYVPPEEFVFKIEFTSSREMKVYMSLWKARKSFMWLMGNGPNKYAGFDAFNHLEVHPGHPNCIDLTLDPTKRHTAVVEVYNDRIRATVDGVVLKDLATNYGEFMQNDRPPYAPKDPSRLAIGMWNSPTTFHKVEVIELSGPGTLKR
jgi:hypothetical protein